ncbi:MAG: primosomal protein N' [Candidatus Omnitrophota bacterium]
MSRPRLIDVAVNCPVEGLFTYSVPKELENDIKIGSLVKVPFGKKNLTGFAVKFSSNTYIKNIRPITDIINKDITLDPIIFELSKWISEYYYCSLGEAISATMPGVLKKHLSKKRAGKKKGKEEEFEYKDGSDKHLDPNKEQRDALASIKDCIDKKLHKVFLLHGVTGSGKTEVYLQSIQHALHLGRSSIVLVPEISLTPQTVARFKARFGDKIAVLHSRLLGSERLSEWQRIKKGEARIVVGARSAVFAPLTDLGLIVVDEEHETSYKQESVPRYNARDAAIKRSELSNAVTILGSATPSLETFYKAQNKLYVLVELPERIDSRLMPKVDIIDMRDEANRKKTPSIFSYSLKSWIEKDIAQGKQVMLFLNRRGFSTFISCRKCGHVITCKKCSVSLTYHFYKKKLICHHCSYNIDPPNVCPECNSSYVKYWGMGTERVESELHRYFPNIRIARMDTDATNKRGSHEKVLSKFKDHKIDILIGTQMIAKGHDFPKVTLVGVVSADTALNLPDFRSGERTFNLLTQVAGRAGRSDLGGRVIIQSYTPHHYAIQAAKDHDYGTFYAKEIELRKELMLPPITHMVSLTLCSRNEEKVLKIAEALRNKFKKLDKSNKIDIVGPAPAPISRMKGQYRWNLFLKSKAVEDIIPLLKKTLSFRKKEKGVAVIVDVDPY